MLVGECTTTLAWQVQVAILNLEDEQCPWWQGACNHVLAP